MATIQDAIKRLVYQFTSTGADKVAADNNMVADSQSKLAVSAQTTTKASLDLTKAFENLEKRFQTTAGVQAQYEAIQTKVNAAVAQHPEFQERANELLAITAARFDKAGESGDVFSKALAKGRESLAGFALEGGAVGALLGSFGPWGVAAAAGVGIVTKALEYMKVNAERTGDASSSLKLFADNTGLSITQVRGLNEAGSQLGISSDTIGSAIQKFTQNLSEARKGSGDLYDQLRVIDKGLAESIASTHSGAEALDILAKAYNSTTDATDRAAIARAAFGKAGASAGGILGAVGDSGGVNEYSGAVQKALGVTDEWTKKVASLRNENKSLEEDLKLVESSFYTEAMLERQNRSLMLQIQIAKAARDAAALPGGATSQWQSPFVQETNRTAGIEPRKFPQGGDPVADSAAIDNAKKATDSLTQAQQSNLESTSRMAAASSTLVSALGGSATAAEKEQARIEALTVSFQAGKISAETYSRALDANPSFKAADDATRALRDQNEMAKANTLQKQKIVAEEQKYAQVLKDTNSEIKASEAAQAVSESYQIKITAATKETAAAALEWQQNMLGVSASAMQAADASAKAADAFENAARAAQGIFFGRGGDFGNFDVPKGKQGTFSGLVGTQNMQQSVAKADVDTFRATGNLIRRDSSGNIISDTANTGASQLNSGVNAQLTQGNFQGALSAALRGSFNGATDQDRLSSVNTLTKYGTSSGQYSTDQLLGMLQSQPETLVRDQAIADLMQSVQSNTTATIANTAAINSEMGKIYSGLHTQYTDPLAHTVSMEPARTPFQWYNHTGPMTSTSTVSGPAANNNNDKPTQTIIIQVPTQMQADGFIRSRAEIARALG